MNCPKCGKEMEEGTMYSQDYPCWTTERGDIRGLHIPEGSFRLHPVGDHTRSPFSFFKGTLMYPGTICQACGTVIFSIETNK